MPIVALTRPAPARPGVAKSTPSIETVDRQACPHWNVTAEPDGEHYSCTACGQVQTQHQRHAAVCAREAEQRAEDYWRAAVDRARAKPMSPGRWRLLRSRLKSGAATHSEVNEFLDEAARRDHDAVVVAGEVGSLLAGFAVLAVWIWFLFGVFGLD